MIASNKRRTLLAAGAFAGCFLLLGLTSLLAFDWGVLVFCAAVIVAVLAPIAAYLRAEPTALALVGAQPADATTHARFHNVVEGLCVASGLSKPDLYVVVDAGPNAMAVGRGPRRASLVVTTGLLEKLNRIELEGVVAHELSHIKSYDVLASTVGVVIARTLALVRLPSLADRALRALLPRRREQIADISGVGLTRYPPGLISALEKLEADSAALQSGPRATAHLWINNRPPLDERIEALREL